MHEPKEPAAEITAAEAGSVAAEAGLRAGDRLLAINSHPLRDVIDVHIYASEPLLTFRIEREGAILELTAERRYGRPLGIHFERLLFEDKVHTCRNACDFCFVRQMPRGLRDPLYVKDDDYRLSFLHGNYITLTNLREEDWERIGEQFLSPLYVSVHAVEPEVRVGLMHNPRAANILDDLQRLVAMGITVHTQAVLVPERNDGAHLDRTIEALADLHPGVADLTVVPVGLTRWHDPRLRPYRDDEAAAVLDQVLAWQTRLRGRLGIGFVYPSDEWFLRAGREAPPREAYDGRIPALYENGVGMVRTFAENWPQLREQMRAFGGRRQAWVTGTLFAPRLQHYAHRFHAETGIEALVVPVENRAFGETITVAGLLTARDIIHALRSRPAADRILLPEASFRGPDGCDLLGTPPASIAQALRRPVHLVTMPAP